MSDLIVSVSITPGPLLVTGLIGSDYCHQAVVHGATRTADVYLHFSPEIAEQWISALAPIATKEPL